jgi:hypothetical protein
MDETKIDQVIKLKRRLDAIRSDMAAVERALVIASDSSISAVIKLFSHDGRQVIVDIPRALVDNLLGQVATRLQVQEAKLVNEIKSLLTQVATRLQADEARIENEIKSL